MRWRTRSFALTWSPSRPSTVTRIVFGRRCRIVCVASTCTASDEPMPHATAPSAPCVHVWLSLQTIRAPGSDSPSSGKTTWTMPWRPSAVSKSWMACSRLLARIPSTMSELHGSSPGRAPRAATSRSGRVEITWSTVANDSTGLWTGRPRLLQLMERVETRQLVQQVAIHVQQAGAVRQHRHLVQRPDLVERAAAHRHGFAASPWRFSNSQTSSKPTSWCNSAIVMNGTSRFTVDPFLSRNPYPAFMAAVAVPMPSVG